MDRHNYMEILSEQIRCKRAIPMVTKEIDAHMDDQKQDFMAEGMSEYEAEAEAVREMGDPVEVGVAMDSIHRPKMNWKMIAGVAAMSILGQLLLYFISREANTPGKDYVFFSPMRQGVVISIGFVLMILICYIDYTKIAHRAKELTIFYFALLLMGTTFAGGSINGSRLYIHLGVGWLSLSMALYLFVPIYGAILYSYRNEGYRGLFKSIAWIFLPVALAIWGAGSLVRALEYVMICAIILSVAVATGCFRVSKGRVIAGMWATLVCGAAGILLYFLYFSTAYHAARIRVILHPGDYAMEEGYQPFVIRQVLKNCKLIGRSDVLPESLGGLGDAFSFSLLYVAAYAGIFAAICVAAALLILYIKALRISLRQKNRLGSLMGVSCVTVMFVQIGLYILANTGIFLSGMVFCPFITCGGNGIWITYVLLGIILSIYRYQNVSAEPETGKLFRKKMAAEES